ncbi:AI-2E family transporter [Prosthecobacter sp.]|uniref:AI-2E family transporter n=1 Tax=Prosthecobacter sp. TaxID=1965333 RepID=UPI002ABB284E|nr:AI-2E family transporter [Prosthecobacter sp.]MDZ4401765.1 AI-2E family transporter [Prosthecobacter sp.]
MENNAPPPPSSQAADEEIPPQQVELHIPWITFVKVAAALLAAYAVYVLWSLLLLVFLALFLAVTLHAFVDWLDARGMKHWGSLLIVIGGLLTVLGIGIALIIPALIEQADAFSKNLPQLHEDALNQLPVGSGIRESIQSLLDSVSWSEASTWFGHFVSAGGIALSGISQITLLLVIAIYLLIDGHKTYDWLLAFFSPLKRAKLRLTASEVSQVIFGYVAGQVITSLLVMVCSFAVLSLLHVPGALMLAILAGVFDILPILGFFIATAPAFLLALSVSPQTAFIVLGLYMLLQLIENYLIVPMIYGKNLRVSTLTVLLGLLAGALLAGIPGALAALPIIASYAAIERIWLKPFLRDGVSEKHELQKDLHFGEKD